MAHYRAALIGAGRPATASGTMQGFGIAYHHAAGYRDLDAIDLVAAADIQPENLETFAATFSVPATYADYREMLRHERPDLVSICTWPGLHPEMVIACAEAGVRGILCEKPMALNLGEVDRMIAACSASGTVLSICHQRRLVPPWTTARTWLEDGRIGQLVRMEGWIESWDLLSYGTHWIDLFFYMKRDQPAEWVLAQIDATSRQRRYAHAVEDRGLTMIGFADGSTGLLHLAPEARGIGVRLIGTEGYIEILEGAVQPTLVAANTAPASAGHEEITPPQGFRAAILDLLDAVERHVEPQLSASHGRRATEAIMAAFASGVERRLITLPFDNLSSPLEQLFADGGA